MDQAEEGVFDMTMVWLETLAALWVIAMATAAPAGTEKLTDPPPVHVALGDYVILGWNDLGMHCMNGEFSQLTILPPFNDLWVQVIHRGNPPQVVTTGVELSYRIIDNTTSSNKVNFWQYEDALFGVDLPNDVGLAGKGLTGTLDWNGAAWEAHGIPLTPFTDSAPTVEQPYQLAEVTLRLTPGGPVKDLTQVVVPVSTEMHCGQCHDGSGNKKSPAARARMAAVAAGLPVRADSNDPIVVAQDILRTHDSVGGIPMMDRRPVLCASCHSSNALGTPGTPGLKSLSQAIHEKHGEEFPTLSCYACHPGQQTQCLRGAMFQQGKTCTDCHGTLLQVASSIAQGRRPWLDEPKCATCHPAYPENANTLYRNSRGHGGLFCEACHGSPHAELPTVQPRDGYQAIRVQGDARALYDCSVCHTSRPTTAGPHGRMAPPPGVLWMLE